MKRIYKQQVTVVLLACMMLLAVPIHVFAHEGTNDGQTSSKIQEIEALKQKKASDLAAKLSEVCSRYTNSRLSTVLGEKKDEFSGKLSNKESDITAKRVEWDSKRTEARTLADAKRQEHYAKLIEQATTDAQKEAIAVFQASVEKAVADRRTSQDTAREEYRKGVDAAVVARKLALEAAANDFKLAVDGALTKAKTSCQNGTPVDEVKATLKTDLEKAKQALKDAKESIPSISDTVKTLAEERKNALEDAKNVFEKALADAKEALKSSLLQTANTVETQTP